MGFVKHSLDVQKILIRTTKKNLQRKKKRGGKKDRMNSVWLRVARGGFGASPTKPLRLPRAQTECVSTTQLYHDTYEHSRFHVSIAGMWKERSQKKFGHLTTAHHSYAFWTSREGLRCGDFQTNEQTNPVNYVNYLRTSPTNLSFGNWYLTGINRFRLTILIRQKWTTQQCWVIKPVPHNLVWRIRAGNISSSAQYWNICTEWWLKSFSEIWIPEREHIQ